MSKAIYVRSVDDKVIKKIDKIKKETGIAKHIIVDKLLSEALGVKTKNKLDVTKWLSW